MKIQIITPVLIAVLFVITSVAYAQMYYAASGAEAVENNGKEWIDKKLPPSVLIFSDNSGVAELKEDISSLVEKGAASITGTGAIPANYADFRMVLDKRLIAEELFTGKVFSTSGFLKINGIGIKVPAQYVLEPSGDIENGFTISVVIRLNPKDFNLRIAGGADNMPLLLKINSGIMNEI